MLYSILHANQIKKADAYTIEHQKIDSIDLMERASSCCVQWISNNISLPKTIKVYCGTGNNGGDGLAISRLLIDKGYDVQPFIIRHNKKMSSDASRNEARLMQRDIGLVRNIYQLSDLTPIEAGDVVIDALFGIGLNKELKNLAAHVVDFINASTAEVISIDMPSGMMSDRPSAHMEHIVKADHTLSFQCYKQAFLYQENQYWLGELHILDIGLDTEYIQSMDQKYRMYDHQFSITNLRSRNTFSHKGQFGHALLIAGKKGMMGAAILSSKACMRSGVGLCTAYIPEAGYEIMQTGMPEVMCLLSDNENYISGLPDIKRFNAIAIGPGIGTEKRTLQTLTDLLSMSTAPLIIDADALNLISENPDLKKLIPAWSILTPHQKEFDRLCGKSHNDFERNEKQIELAKELKVYVLLKGKNSCIATPDGNCFINTSGNPGMATAGSGDVLTGIILSFVAQGYEPREALMIAVNIHGLAGDFAFDKKGNHSMIASDIVDFLPDVFLSMENIRSS